MHRLQREELAKEKHNKGSCDDECELCKNEVLEYLKMKKDRLHKIKNYKREEKCTLRSKEY